eukprot:3521851-Amphidinium_carterae.1
MRFQRKHALQMTPCRARSRTQPVRRISSYLTLLTGKLQRRSKALSAVPPVHLASSRVPGLWFLICVLTSAPGVLYSMVKTVPGFLPVSGIGRSLLSNAVALFSGVVTSFGLDYLAEVFSRPAMNGRKGVDGATLQLC